MARIVERLNPLGVERAKRPGMYHDGRGLYLHVGPTGGKSWIFRYQLEGKARQMGLGPYPDVGLQRAREKLAALRSEKADGVDPLDAKEARRAAAKAEAAKAITFKACAEKYIKANRAGWRNAKHAAQWTSTLTAYAFPVIGDVAVGLVDTGHVTRVLEPIWTTKPETASRVRGRVEAVLDYAKVHGWRVGENPARWKGHLENALPKRGKVRAVEHHAALSWRDVGAFFAELRRQEGIAARALEFTILTAARTGEVIGARWGEFDLDDGIWTVPASRMKASHEHRVPLSKPALALLRAIQPSEMDLGAFVFPGAKPGKPMSNMSMAMLLRRMERDDLTVHGFRSTFRDWAAERTKFPRELAEKALAHTLTDKAEAAYQRADMIEKRKQMMQAWADYCSRPAQPDGKVVPLARVG